MRTRLPSLPNFFTSSKVRLYMVTSGKQKTLRFRGEGSPRCHPNCPDEKSGHLFSGTSPISSGGYPGLVNGARSVKTYLMVSVCGSRVHSATCADTGSHLTRLSE